MESGVVHYDTAMVRQLSQERKVTVASKAVLPHGNIMKNSEKSEKFNVPAVVFPILTHCNTHINTLMCRDSILKWCMRAHTYT